MAVNFPAAKVNSECLTPTRGSLVPLSIPIGPALGPSPEVVFTHNEKSLRRGDRLIFYSDGVPDTVDSTGQTFGVSRNVWVIEKRLRPGDLSADEASRILPQADVVCLTGTALINHTLDELLGYCHKSYVVLTGPSAPLSPVLFDFGIAAICGTRVTDPNQVKRYITQGACFRQLKGHGVRLLTLHRD